MKRLAAAAALIVLTASACGSSNDTATTTAPTTVASGSGGTSTSAAPSSSAPTVQLASSEYGSILVDGQGMTLYMFTPDAGGKSTCNSTCAATWPALTGKPTGVGVGADDLGTITRDDGTTQATFYGHPVYHYAGDAKAGDVTGEGTGGKWFVLDKDGNPVKTAAGATTTTTAPPTTSARGY